MPPSPAAVTEGTPADMREWTAKSDGPTPHAPIDGCKVSRACQRSGLVILLRDRHAGHPSWATRRGGPRR